MAEKYLYNGEIYDLADNISPADKAQLDDLLKSGKAKLVSDWLFGNQPRSKPDNFMQGALFGKLPGTEVPARSNAEEKLAINRFLKTTLADMPGATLSGGPAGLASSVLMNSVLPESMMDESGADSARTFATSMAGGPLGSILGKVIRNPAIRNAIGGGISSALGIGASEAVEPNSAIRAEPGGMSAPASTATQILSGALIPGAATGILGQSLREKSPAGIREALGTVASEAGAVSQRSPRLASTKAAYDIKTALDEQYRAITQPIKDEINKTKRDLSVKQDFQTLVNDRMKIMAGYGNAKTLGEKKFYETLLEENKKSLEIRNLSESEKLFKQFPALSKVNVENTQPFKDVLKNQQQALKDNEQRFKELQKNLQDVNKLIESEAKKPETFGLVRGKVPKETQSAQRIDELNTAAREIKSEIESLAGQRNQIISNSNSEVDKLVDRELSRQNIKTFFGDDIERTNEKIAELSTKLRTSTIPGPPALKAALAGTDADVFKLVNYVRQSSQEPLRDIVTYFDQNNPELSKSFRSMVINDIFDQSRTRDGKFNGFAAVTQGANAPYPVEKLSILFGDEKKATKFVDLAQRLNKVVSADTFEGELYKFGKRQGIRVLANSVVFGLLGREFQYAAPAGAGAIFLTIGIPEFVNRLLENPAAYEIFKDYEKGLAAGVQTLSPKLIQYFKQSGRLVSEEGLAQIQQQGLDYLESLKAKQEPAETPVPGQSPEVPSPQPNPEVPNVP